MTLVAAVALAATVAALLENLPVVAVAPNQN
jgi:hypothetical protein